MAQAVTLLPGADGDGFRNAVRGLLAAGVAPEEVVWGENPSIFESSYFAQTPAVMLPRGVPELAALVVCHKAPERYALLYALIWRVTKGERQLLENPADALVHKLQLMAKSVRRDMHKMHAFLRFHKVAGPEERFIAWFEPEHYILEATAGFFTERFANLRWSILTPVGCLHWDTERLTLGPAAEKPALPADGFEAGWCDYYEATFNPARLNPAAMRKEMPQRYWKNMPETRAIPEMMAQAPARMREMAEQEARGYDKRNPDKAVAVMLDQAPKSLAELNQIIAASPPLVPGATRAVLGEGAMGGIAFVGEQPGDAEDLSGRPFVGPAGQLLNRALEESGIDRSTTYVTNAVKHFKFEERGKQRIHSKPTAGEVKHYRWWLMQELEFVKPKVTVALGATALLALTGKQMPLLRSRGAMAFEGRPGFVTMHPSYLLRLPDERAKREAYAGFVEDLRKVANLSR